MVPQINISVTTGLPHDNTALYTPSFETDE